MQFHEPADDLTRAGDGKLTQQRDCGTLDTTAGAIVVGEICLRAIGESPHLQLLFLIFADLRRIS